MHGLGNDFVVIDGRTGGSPVTPALARALGDRHRGGVRPARGDPAGRRGGGGGGFLERGRDAGSRLRERDALRGAAPPRRERGRCRGIRTGRGVLQAEEAGGGLIRVNMGRLRLTWAEVPLARDMDLDPTAGGQPRRGRDGQPRTASSWCRTRRRWMLPASARGSSTIPVPADQCRVRAGHRPRHDSHARLGARDDHAGLRVGGLCRGGGDGAAGADGRRVTVRLDGGDLGIDWRADGVWMTGPAALVFEGAPFAAVRAGAGVSVFETFGCRLNAYETGR